MANFESRREAVQDRSRFTLARCRKAASASGFSPSDLLTSNQSLMQSQGRRQQEDAKEQLQHLRSQSYISVRPIAQRIAGQAIRVAKLGKPGQSRSRRSIEPRHYSLPQWVEQLATRSWDNLQVIDQHPILDAIHRPNGFSTDWGLKWVSVASLEVTGWAYWWFPKVKGQLQIWHVPTPWVLPQHEGQLFSGWTLRPDGGQETLELPGNKLAPFWYPSPLNPLASISPMEAGAKEILVNEYVIEAQRRAFASGLHPGTIVKIRKKGGDDKSRPRLRKWQRNQLMERINEEVRGMLHYGDPFIADDQIESIDNFGNKPNEMDFSESGGIAQARVEQVFGTNPYIAGAKGGGSRAEAAEADGQFVYGTVNPKIELLSRVMTIAVVPQFDNSGTLIMFIEPCRPRDAEMELKEWALGGSFGGYTINEFRNNVMRLPSVPWGEERVQVARTNITSPDGTEPEEPPAETPDNEEGPDDETDNPPDDDSDEGDESGGKHAGRIVVKSEAKKQDFLSAWLASHERYESELASGIAKFFAEQEKAVVRRLEAMIGPRRSAGEIAGKDTAHSLSLGLMTPEEWTAEFRSTVEPKFHAAMLAGAGLELAMHGGNKSHTHLSRRDTLTDIGHDLGVGFPEDVASGIDRELGDILGRGYWRDIQETTRNHLVDQIREGVLAGETLRELVDRIEENVFSGNIASERATLIARTESTGALNAGQEEARVWLEREGVIEAKEWFATNDMRTRPTHLSANGQVRRIGQSFDVGGYQGRYPGDPNLPARERCNCRCASASVTEFSGVRSVRSALIVPRWVACSIHGGS